MIPTAHQLRKTQFPLCVLLFLFLARTLAAVPPPQTPVPPDSIPVLCAQASAGDSFAVHRLNQYLLQHDSTAANYDAALSWLRNRAANGNPNSEFLLGYLFEHGHGVPQDLAQAITNYQAASSQGNSVAQNNLASLYQRGLGVPRDLQKARELYLSSVRQNNSAAQTNLASMYYVGDGVPRDVSEAARWFLAAANLGDPTAQHNLGVLYYLGEGVPKDLAASAKWIGRSATQNLGAAQTDLAFLYETGIGVSQDDFAAYLWYSRALASGDSTGASRRDAIARRLTAKQRDEGRTLATTPPSAPHNGFSWPAGSTFSVLPKH